MAMCRLDIPRCCSTAARLCPVATTKLTSPSKTCTKPSVPTPPAASTTINCASSREKACPGAGSCGGQFTANTMATAAEILGVALMGSGSVPATDPRKEAVGTQVGALAVELVRQDRTPSQSSPAPPSTTPSAPLPPLAVRPTACCTFWPSPGKPDWNWTLRTSRP